MRRGMFCPSCGSTKGPFFKGLCRSCFLGRTHLVQLPEEIKIEHCRQCNRVKLGGKWTVQSESAIKNFLAKKARVKELQEPELEAELEPFGENTLAIVRARGLLDGNRIEAEAKTLLVAVEMQCNDCMLLRSDYFEATIQARFSRGASEEKKQAVLLEIDEMLGSLQTGNTLARIVNVVRKKNGFDALLASNSAAKKVVKRLAGKARQPVKQSFKLVSRDSKGHEKKRFTYCLRF